MYTAAGEVNPAQLGSSQHAKNSHGAVDAQASHPKYLPKGLDGFILGWLADAFIVSLGSNHGGYYNPLGAAAGSGLSNSCALTKYYHSLFVLW